MSNINSNNISFSDLKEAWENSEYSGGSNPGTDISLSEFRGATFTDGTIIPSTGEISISDFKDKTFDSGGITTDQFRAYSYWSSHSNSLQGLTGSSTYTGSTVNNKRIGLNNTGQSSSYPYPILLLSPSGNSSDTPGIIVDRSNSDVVDEATVWFRVVAHSNYNQVQFGIVAKDMTTNNWTTQKSYLRDKHGTYCDRLSFHGAGFHNYSGSRDDITSSSTIVSPQYKSGTYGSTLTTYFHTRTGKSAGTQRSNNAASAPGLGTNAYFFKNNLYNYSTYRSNSLYPNHGIKIKWYETTIQANLVFGTNVIQPVNPPSTWSSSDLNDVFSGMYISGNGINTDDGAFIADVNTNYMVIYKSKGSSTNSLEKSNAISSQTNVTLTISGYLYWTLVTSPDVSSSNTNYMNPKILGPPHQVLPKYQAATSTSAPTTEITEWAFYIGDTTTNNNSFSYDLRNSEPSGSPFSYSVTYSSKTLPENYYYNWKYYAYGSSIGTIRVYWYSGTTLTQLRSISGQQHTGYGQTWDNYVEDLTPYAGQTGYIVYSYKTGNYFYNDVLIDEMKITDNSTTLYNVGPLAYNWRRYANGTSTTSTVGYNTSSTSLPTTVTSSNWVTLLTSQSTTYGWVLDGGGTPSSSTGNTVDASGSSSGNYIYFEGSSPNYTTGTRYYWLRSNSITLSQDDY